jgi:hypothetical protein
VSHRDPALQERARPTPRGSIEKQTRGTALERANEFIGKTTKSQSRGADSGALGARTAALPSILPGW